MSVPQPQPQPLPQPLPPAAAPAAKRRWPLVVGGGFAVIVAFAMFAGGGSDGGATVTTGGDAGGGVENAAAEKTIDGTAPYGSTVTFDDGSTLTCTEPARFKPDTYAVYEAKKKFAVKTRCTFVNNSDETFDPALTSGSLSADGEEGASIYQQGLDAPDNPVLPGRKVSWSMGYSVASTKAMELTVSIGFFDHPEITFI